MATDRDAAVVYSEALDVWLHATTGPDGVAPRVCRDPEGQSVVLTPSEQRAARAEEAAQRWSVHAERAALEVQRANREAANERQKRAELEAELAQLRAQLAARS